MGKRRMFFRLKQAVSSLLVAGLLVTLVPMGMGSVGRVVEAAVPTSLDFSGEAVQSNLGNSITREGLRISTDANRILSIDTDAGTVVRDPAKGEGDAFLFAQQASYFNIQSTDLNTNFKMNSIYLNFVNYTQVSIQGYDDGQLVIDTGTVTVDSNGMRGSGGGRVSFSNYYADGIEVGVSVSFVGSGWFNVDEILITTGTLSSPIIDDIHVSAPFIPMTLTADFENMDEDRTTALTGNVFANDVGDNLSIVSVETELGIYNMSPDGLVIRNRYGTLTIDPDGRYAYVLDHPLSDVQNLYVNDSLIDSFTYTVTNGVEIDMNSAQFSVIINGLNERPTSESTTVVMDENQGFDFQGTEFAYADAENQPLRGVQFTGLPASGKGVLLLNGNPVLADDIVSAGDLAGLSYVPNPNSYGNPQATATFKVIDNSGEENASSASAYTLNFKVNRVISPPPLTVTSPTDGSSLGESTVTVTGTSEPGVTINIVIGTDTYSTIVEENGEWSKTIASLADGEYTVSVQASDANQLVSSLVSRTFTVDDTAPLLVVTTPVNGNLTNANPVTFAGISEQGASISIEVNGQTYGGIVDGTFAWDYAVTGLEDGTYFATVKAVDANLNETVQTVSFRVDTTPPAFTITSPAPRTLTNLSFVRFEGTGEPGVAFTLRIFNQTFYGNVLVDGTWNYSVWLPADGKYTLIADATDAAGNTTSTWQSVGEAGTSDGQLNEPTAIAFDSDGSYYVIQNGNSKIMKFDANHHFMFAVEAPGSRPNPLPQYLAVGANHELYVSNTLYGSVEVYDRNGQHLRRIQVADPTLLTTDANGNVYICSSVSQNIYKYDANGNYLDEVYVDVFQAKSMTADQQGNLYVADHLRGKVYKYNPQLDYLGQFSSYGDQPGEIVYPGSMTTDASGNLYVADWQLQRISKFDSNGLYVGQFGQNDSSAGGYGNLTGIAVSPNGELYALDAGYNKINIYSLNAHNLMLSLTYDSVAPQVLFVTNGQVTNQAVFPTFFEGTATLTTYEEEARPFVSGTVISEEGWYTLRVTDAAGNVNMVTFVIDYTAPIAPTVSGIEGAASSYTSDTTPTIQGTAEQFSVVNVRIGNIELDAVQVDVLGNWSYTFEEMPEGQYAITVTATDEAGNESLTSDVYPLTVDTTRPSEPGAIDLLATSDSGASDSDNLTRDDTPTFTGLTEPYAAVSLFENGGLVGSGLADEQGIYEITVTRLTDGEHTITAKATDRSGNTSEASAGLAVIVDTHFVGEPRISWTPTLQGIAFVVTYPEESVAPYVKLETGEWSAYVGPISVNESVTLYAYALDVAGNPSNEVSRYFSSVATRTAIKPSTQLGFYGSNAQMSHNDGSFLPYSGAALSDEGFYTVVYDHNVGAIVRVVFDMDSIPPTVTGVENNGFYNEAVSPSFQDAQAKVRINGRGFVDFTSGTALTEEGTYLLSVYDSAFNYTQVYFEIDYTPPVEATFHASTMESTNQDVTVTIDYPQDAVVKQVKSGNDGEWNTYIGPITLTGNKQVFARSYDLAGNVSIASMLEVENIDKTAPVVTGVTNRHIYTGDITVNYDEGTALLTKYGEEAVQFHSGETIGAEGTYVLIVTDQVGNRTTVTFTIDRTAPEAPSLSTMANPTKGPLLVGIRYATDAVLKEYKVGDGDWQTYTKAVELTENTTIYARATDEAGLVSFISQMMITNIDREAPAAPTAIGLLDGKTEINETSATVIGKAVQASKVMIYLDDEKRGEVEVDDADNWTFDFTRLAVGTHEVNVIAVDEAGNESSASSVFVFTVDQTAPTLTGVRDGGIYASAVTPIFTEGTATLRKNNGDAFPQLSGKAISGDGSYILSLMDTAGNVNTVAFTIDGIAPVISDVRDGGLYGISATVSFNEGTGWLTQLGVGTREVTSGTAVTAVGSYVLTVTDAAGNRSVVMFDIDKAGFVPKITPSKTSSTRDPITFTVKADNARYTLSYKLGETGEWKTYTGAVTLTENTKIFARAADLSGRYSSEVSYTVTNLVQRVTSIKVNQAALVVGVKKAGQLIATVAPSTATNKAVTWTSSNVKVAKVDKNGKVTGVAAGTATIIARSVESGLTATVKVTVVVPVAGVKLNATAAKLKVKKSTQLVATVSPKTATMKAVTWTSSNAAIAKVDAKGKVTAVKPGKVVITAKTKEGNKVATCTITVT